MPTAPIRSNCAYCGRSRPLYAVFTEDDSVVWCCAECIGFRQVKDD